MPIFVCDEVLNRMIASLSYSVKAAYSLPGETIRYPIFIGAGDSGNAIGSRIAAMLRQTEGAEIAFYPLDVGQKGEELSEVNPEHFKPKLFSHLGNSCTPSFFSRLRTFFGTSVIWSNPS